LATQNSKESTWIPWELGLSDGYITYQNTIILPVTESANKWDEVEYYGVYGHIEKAYSNNKSIHDWAVIYPDKRENNLWLREWLVK